MISLSFFKKMNVESFSNAWKSNLSCEECSIRLGVFRKKKVCFFCKNFFCQVCIMRREDKKFCCRKCQILTARPLNRNELLNLRSRDLVNYLTSRHISTNGCVEKEDLVNVLMRAVNNSCFHPSSNPLDGSSCTNSCPNTPRNTSFAANQAQSTKRRLSQSVENLYNDDGIRIRGHNEVFDEDNNEEDDKAAFTEERSSQQERLEEAGQSSDFIEQEENNRLSSHQADTENIKDDSVSSGPRENNEPVDLNRPIMLSDIKCSNDLDSLSVKQLKELLLRNRTDFKGCIERVELLQKANRLWNDYILSRQDLDNLSIDELCKICMDAPIECVLLECGHMATCTSCGKQLCECPICRQFVVRCVRTFKA